MKITNQSLLNTLHPRRSLELIIEYEYSITIIRDRYNGTYSKGIWIAYPHDGEIPDGPQDDDLSAMEFWNQDPLVGRGDTPNKALRDLKKNIRTILSKLV
jgi:hypothetical protein